MKNKMTVIIGVIAVAAALQLVGGKLKKPRICYGHQFGYKVQVDALGNDMTQNPYMKAVISECEKNLTINGTVVETMAARYDLQSELPKRGENEPRLGRRPN